MLYLVLQISVFLVAAAIVGFASGWLLRGVTTKPELRMSARTATVEQLNRARETAKIARSELAAKAEELTIVQEELSQRNGEISLLQRTLDAEQTSAPGTRAQLADGEIVLNPADVPNQLSKIRGIGPVTEKLLNELGYTTFEQVANFTNEDIDRIAEKKPSLRARIEREDWPKWARKRYEETTGTDLD